MLLFCFDAVTVGQRHVQNQTICGVMKNRRSK